MKKISILLLVAIIFLIFTCLPGQCASSNEYWPDENWRISTPAEQGNKRIIHRLPDYLKMIRDQDLIPGLSCHMPELVVYSDLNGYDLETYIQIYNCLGFLMQVEVEYIHQVIWNAKKPVITIKPMAAGRVSPFVGLTFSWHTIRPRDLITVGCLTPEEAAEDIEISLAALENRPPDLEGRDSPNKTEIMKSKGK